jgi:dihydrofolate reductase
VGRIVVTEFVSLDGVMEDPGGAEDYRYGGWTFEIDDKFNSMPKYVVSTTLEAPGWTNSTVLDGDLAQAVATVRERHGGDVVVHGSASLVQALLDRDLVDELRLMVFPVVLGAGKRLFGETSDKKRLRLVDSKTVGDGVAILVYQRAAE